MAGFGKDGKGQILHDEITINVGALLDNAAKKQAIPYTLEDDFRIIKVEWALVMKGGTAGEGPLWVCLCDNQLSEAQIAEAVNA